MQNVPFQMNEPSALKPKFDPGDRPLTSKNGKAARQKYVIVAITENRAREVGFAVVDLGTMLCIDLIQMTDNQSHSLALGLLEILQPTEIIMSKSQMERQLMQKIIARFGSDGSSARAQCTFTTIARKFFDEVRGESTLKQISCDESAAQPGGRAELSGRYLALAALSALVQYVEHIQHITWGKRSVTVTWSGGEGRMALDFETVLNLELLANSRTGDVRGSLLGVIDATKTSVGSRLLQAQILSPMADRDTLESRLDAVDALLGGDDAYVEACACMAKLPDLDNLLASFVYTPKVSTPRTARAAISAVIGLKHTLEMLPNLSAALDAAPAGNSELLSIISANLKHPVFQALCVRIGEVITEDTSWARSAAAARQQEVFAVKPGLDGALDAVRKIYADCVQEIFEEAEQLRLSWDIPGLKLNYTAARGYHLLLPASVANSPPEGLVQAVRMRGGGIAASTDTLSALNDRVRENLFSTYVLTNSCVQSLHEHVRHAMPALSRAAESVALLDMLAAFAANVLNAPAPDAYCRPTFASGPDACTIIEGGRHPIVERMSRGAFIPNNLSLTPRATTMVLTGPNCSGKSTFLRQTALLHVLAHLGAYVPARRAQFRITTRICTRLGTGDDLEANASSFLKEMKEAAFALAHAGDASLILIDELGRGTSNEDGVGVAWAVVESLALRTAAYTLLTTHYHELAEMSTMMPTVRNLCMAVDIDAGAAAGGGAYGSATSVSGIPSLKFRFNVTEGASGHKTDYGLALAAMCGLPEAVLSDARHIKASMAERLSAVGRPGTSVPASILLGRAQGTAASGGTGARAGAPATASSSSMRPDTAGGARASAAALASRDTLLRVLMDRLKPIVTGMQAGSMNHQDAEAMVVRVYKDLGPALRAAGVDGSLADSDDSACGEHSLRHSDSGSADNAQDRQDEDVEDKEDGYTGHAMAMGMGISPAGHIAAGTGPAGYASDAGYKPYAGSVRNGNAASAPMASSLPWRTGVPAGAGTSASATSNSHWRTLAQEEEEESCLLQGGIDVAHDAIVGMRADGRVELMWSEEEHEQTMAQADFSAGMGAEHADGAQAEEEQHVTAPAMPLSGPPADQGQLQGQAEMHEHAGVSTAVKNKREGDSTSPPPSPTYPAPAWDSPSELTRGHAALAIEDKHRHTLTPPTALDLTPLPAHPTTTLGPVPPPGARPVWMDMLDDL